jgi:hypothetical protein
MTRPTKKKCGHAESLHVFNRQHFVRRRWRPPSTDIFRKRPREPAERPSWRTSKQLFQNSFANTVFACFCNVFPALIFSHFLGLIFPPPHPNRQTFGLALASIICRYLPCFVCSLPLCWLVFFLSLVFYCVLLYLPLSLSLSGSLNSLLEPFAASNRGCALGCFTLQITGLDWKAWWQSTVSNCKKEVWFCKGPHSPNCRCLATVVGLRDIHCTLFINSIATRHF